MEGRKRKNHTARFLIASFLGLLIFSIIAFSGLGIYMTRMSHSAFHEIGQIYMAGMSEQIASHFESVIKLRFNQVHALVSVVPSDGRDQEELYSELVYRARARDFGYLALCSSDGNFETLYGEFIQPLNPEPFVEARRWSGESSGSPSVKTPREKRSCSSAWTPIIPCWMEARARGLWRPCRWSTSRISSL